MRGIEVHTGLGRRAGHLFYKYMYDKRHGCSYIVRPMRWQWERWSFTVALSLCVRGTRAQERENDGPKRLVPGRSACDCGLAGEQRTALYSRVVRRGRFVLME